MTQEEAKLEQIAVTQAHKAQHHDKLRKVEENYEASVKWRKTLQESLDAHRTYMKEMSEFFTHSIVFIRQSCIHDYGMTPTEYEEQVTAAKRTHSRIKQSASSVDNALTEAIAQDKPEATKDKPDETEVVNLTAEN